MLSFSRRSAPPNVRATLHAAFWMAFVAGAAGASATGCEVPRKTIEVTVTARDELPAIDRLVVAASGEARTVSVTTSGPAPLPLPKAVRLNVSSLADGEIVLEATAFDSAQMVVARGTSNTVLPASGSVIIELRCQTALCARPGIDAGSDGARDAGADTASDSPETDGAIVVSPTCGNGQLDPGETCDTARAPPLPGACPASCDDGIACTQDQRTGDRCSTSCAYVEVTTRLAGDGCCPVQADYGADTDCSADCGNGRVDPGEACDSAIAVGPGACPVAGACDDNDPCTVDVLISEGTCSARCTHRQIVALMDGDACCPLAADATTDRDCPASCGNGVLEPGETCDTRITSGAGVCPTVTSCEDILACTADALIGTGCQALCTHRTINSPAPGDGCCPRMGLARNVDADCPAICGNGLVERGETCDRALVTPVAGACPLSCPPPPVACIRYVMQGSVASCSAVCIPQPTAACSPVSDGCCPTGCTPLGDPDCAASCGNGRVDPGEACDTAITAGAGSCPRSCASGVPCTDDLLVDADTCQARCVFVPTAALRNGDGCCPPGAHAGIDSDCPAACGNGVVESPWETCDTATSPASCQAACPPPEACATWQRIATSDCDARCVRQPVTACASGDGCCPAGCGGTSDRDCPPRCGNGVLEAGETCDRGITAGHLGACTASCADSDGCTLDFASGSAESCTRLCTHVRITACGGGDRCCPLGCTGATDSDCAPSCGDGQVQAQETCDPASTCPTSCPGDGDPCTVDQLVGSPSTCTAACAHIPILRCSGTQRDGCCPTECSTVSDYDC